MTSYEFWSLIISSFAALGTCGATGLALYFWFHENKIKLNLSAFRCKITNGVYEFDPTGDNFQFNLTNATAWPVNVQIVGLKIYAKRNLFRKLLGSVRIEDGRPDNLPKKLEYGERFLHVMPINTLRTRLDKIKDDNIIYDLEIFASVTTAKKNIVYKLEKDYKAEILKFLNNS